jgi:hypothetical protein
MSVSGISSSNLLELNMQATQTRLQQFRQEFQQLGQDLQSGNLLGAQADFKSLQQLGPQANPTQSGDAIAQDFNQLSQDLKSGNLSGAQQDFAKIQQDLQSRGQHVHGHHHHSGQQTAKDINQELGQLGQALQSGDLATAQQAYTSLQQDSRMLAQANPALAAQPISTSGSNGVSVNA